MMEAVSAPLQDMQAGMPGGLDPSAGTPISLTAQAELELELSLRGSLLVQQQRRIVQLEDELQRAWAEIERLRGKLSSLEREKPHDEDGSRAPRYWTPEEHTLFVEAVQRYGWKDVKAISQHVGTRNPTQVRTHAQKLLLRQQKEQAGVMQQSNSSRELPPIPPEMLQGANDRVGRGGGLGDLDMTAPSTDGVGSNADAGLGGGGVDSDLTGGSMPSMDGPLLGMLQSGGSGLDGPGGMPGGMMNGSLGSLTGSLTGNFHDDVHGHSGVNGLDASLQALPAEA